MDSDLQSEPAGRRKPKGERTRQRILEAAESLFAERGYEGTTIAVVAKEVGIQQPGVFYYFADKHSLYEAVVDEALGSVERTVLASLSGAGAPGARLLRSVEAWVEAVASRPTLARLVLHEAANPNRGSVPAKLRAVGTRVFERFIGTLADHHGAEIDEVDALHFTSAMQGATLFFVAANSQLVGGSPTLPLEPDAMQRHKELMRATAQLLMRRARTS